MGGYINLTDTLVETLPAQLKVNGDLSVMRTPLETLPEA
ncbi:hypothetical protein JCM19233_4747 [Vibrio astriarenae]|nr:hypothetical protein JCM19233_4747 [Vibrio sp. C7]